MAALRGLTQSIASSRIDAILDHCNLPGESFTGAREHYQSKLRAPDYYQYEISEDVLEEIWDIVSPVAEWFGYARRV